MNTFRSYQRAVEFYRATATLQLKGHLKMQLSRAASSIVLNLAEGAGRRTPADQRHFYQIAFGSLRECQAILEISGLETKSQEEIADQLAGQIYKLIQSAELR